MSYFFNTLLFDNGLSYVATRAAAGDTIKLHLVKAYTRGDSYATVLGNSVGSVALAAGDLTLSGSNTYGRKVTTAAKTGVTASANSGATPDLHYAILNETSSAVLAVTNETTDRQILSGDTLNFGAANFVFDHAA